MSLMPFARFLILLHPLQPAARAAKKHHNQKKERNGELVEGHEEKD
jgi:hypothetical protein